MCRTWRVVSEEDSRHVNGVLGALVRHYFPGIVTHAGKDEPAYTWAHYESAHHATAGNVAAHILQEFWVSLPRTTCLNATYSLDPT